MRQNIDFLFTELYSQRGAKDTTYDRCFSLFDESENSNEQCGYFFKLNKSLQCEIAGKGEDARAWGILALCCLTDEIVKIREQLLANNINLNPLDIDLQIALNLPGEQIECYEIYWPAFDFGYVENTGNKTVDIAQVRERLEKSMMLMPENKNFDPLGELSRLSSFYIDVLAWLSILGRGF